MTLLFWLGNFYRNAFSVCEFLGQQLHHSISNSRASAGTRRSSRCGKNFAARGKERRRGAKFPAPAQRTRTPTAVKVPIPFLFHRFASAHLAASAAMPPCRGSNFGYCGVRLWPAGNFYAEIRVGNDRIVLGTFETAHEAARAYDAAATRRDMKFHDVNSREQAEMLALLPCLVTQEEQWRHRALQ